LRTLKVYDKQSTSQAKSSNIQENLATQSNGSRQILCSDAKQTRTYRAKQPVYNDTVPFCEQETEAFLTTWSCNKRLAIINFVLNQITFFKGYYRVSHGYIAEQLDVSEDYTQQTLKKAEKLGIFRVKHTYNGSNIHTINPEFKSSGIMQRLRPYFPGLRSFFSLVCLLSSLSSCPFLSSISPFNGKTRSDIKGDLRALLTKDNIESYTGGIVEIDKNLEISTLNKELKTEETPNKGETTFNYGVFPFPYSSNKDTPISPTPSEEELVEIRKKREKDLLDNAKREQQERSPKRFYPFLSEEGIYFAVSTGMSPWEAALLSSIPANDMVRILVKFSAVLFKSKIGLFQASRYLKREQKTKVIYRDVIHSTKKLAWWFVRTELAAFGLKLDYGLAATVRNYYGLREDKVMSMHDQSIFMKSLSNLSNKLDVFRKLSADEYALAARKAKIDEHKDRKEREKLRAQHREIIQHKEFKEDDIEEDRYREDGIYDEDENSPEDESISSQDVSMKQRQQKETKLVNHCPALAPVLTPQEQCAIDITNYRTGLSKTLPFMYDMMKTNFTNILKEKYSFLPPDFDILTY
jgi:hypothetical protein